MGLKPLADRVIVRACPEEGRTVGGIIIPDNAQEKPQRGVVVAAGTGRLDEQGARAPLEVAVGDEVLYSKYGGTEIKVDGEDLLVLREQDILALVD